MYSVRNRVDTGFATSLRRRAGAAHLGAAGLLNGYVAVRLYGAVGSESAFLALLSILEGRWTESELLARGETLSVLVGTVVPVLVAVALILGVVQCVAAVLAATGRGYRLAIGSALAGSVTIVTIPLCAVAFLLCWCSRDRFGDRSAESPPAASG